MKFRCVKRSIIITDVLVRLINFLHSIWFPNSSILYVNRVLMTMEFPKAHYHCLCHCHVQPGDMHSAKLQMKLMIYVIFIKKTSPL